MDVNNSVSIFNYWLTGLEDMFASRFPLRGPPPGCRYEADTVDPAVSAHELLHHLGRALPRVLDCFPSKSKPKTLPSIPLLKI